MTEKNEDKYFTLDTINQLGLERNEKLDAIEQASGGGGGGDATAANQTTIIANQTNGTSKVQVMGNTEADGSGTSEHLHTDGNGNLNVQLISTALTQPSNSTNSGITDAPANSVAVGLKARTDKALASSETFLLCDSQGHLQVDLLNQNVSAQLEAFTDINDVSSVKRLLCDTDGHLQVDIVSGGGGGSSATNLYPTLASITTATDFAGGQIASDYIDLTNAKNIVVNCIHTGNATARSNFGSDIAISMEFTDDNTATVCYSGASSPAFAFGTIQADGTTTGSAVAVLSLGENNEASSQITGKFGRIVTTNSNGSGTNTAYLVDFKVVISGI